MKPWSSAIISGNGLFRYELTRKWQAKGKIALFIMLNPSTADAHKDDPTIRKCIFYAKREGCAGIRVVNLFAYRARDPLTLSEVDDPVGPRNDYFVYGAIRKAHAKGAPIILAWGNSIVRARMTEHAVYVLKYAELDKALCFGLTRKYYQPKHPLYLPNDAPLLSHRSLMNREGLLV